jgi:leader peptidase (prepilin peptidase)/N-methyltransferase
MRELASYTDVALSSRMPVGVALLLASPLVGSFLGVLIRRLPEGRPVLLARSACESCGRRLGPIELVPVLSYLAQSGRCRGCGARIDAAHAWIEIAAVLIPLSAIAAGATGSTLLAGVVLGWTLLALSWIDLKHLRLPDVLTLPLVLLGLAATWLLDPGAAASHALGAMLGYVAFRGIALAYRRLRGRDGLGEGDAKLLAAAGAWVGPEALNSVVLAAALSGLALSLALRLRGKRLRADTLIPFGPCLAAGTWLVWLSQSTPASFVYWSAP